MSVVGVDARAEQVPTGVWSVRAGDVDARLLAGPPPITGPEDWASHQTRLGAMPDDEPAALRALLRSAGLVGRGGGGFLTAEKLDVAVAADGVPLVVVNASEGEPASEKDQTLAALRPHLVIDGALVLARAVGAPDIVIYTHASRHDVNAALRRALEERATTGVHVRLVEGPETYIAGETSAVVSYLDGRGALPTRGAVPAARRGVAGRPTVVNNVETVAHAALIARRGAEWFREVGAPEAPGSTLLTLTGVVTTPRAVIEIVGPVTLGEVLVSHAGLSSPPAAVLLGGYEGTWIAGETAWRLPIERHRLARAGLSLGCGVVGVVSGPVCAVAETARLVRWLTSQSAGQCGPCVFGLPSIRDEVDRLAQGRARRGDLRHLRHLVHGVRGRGACGHPTGVANLVESLLDALSAEVDRHIHGAHCAPTPGVFPLPHVGA